VFVPGESFQYGLDLRVGSGAYKRETSALLTNIILGWGGLPGIKTLAYLVTLSVMKKLIKYL
jgi:hypothetical protein